MWNNTLLIMHIFKHTSILRIFSPAIDRAKIHDKEQQYNTPGHDLGIHFRKQRAMLSWDNQHDVPDNQKHVKSTGLIYLFLLIFIVTIKFTFQITKIFLILPFKGSQCKKPEPACDKNIANYAKYLTTNKPKHPFTCKQVHFNFTNSIFAVCSYL